MDNIFYNRVSGWVKAYRNTDALDWVRKFVNNSEQSQDIKDKLHKEIDYKEQKLRAKAGFVTHENEQYLATDKGELAKWHTRFGVVCKCAELALKGYDVEVVQKAEDLFLIKLNSPNNEPHP